MNGTILLTIELPQELTLTLDAKAKEKNITLDALFEELLIAGLEFNRNQKKVEESK